MLIYSYIDKNKQKGKIMPHPERMTEKIEVVLDDQRPTTESDLASVQDQHPESSGEVVPGDVEHQLPTVTTDQKLEGTELGPSKPMRRRPLTQTEIDQINGIDTDPADGVELRN